MAVRASDFDYPLDEALIAQEPLARRDQSRLMVLRRGEGRIEHHVFSELPELLRKGDVLVLNETAVIPARFACRRKSGGRIEGLFLREVAAGQWEVLLKGAGRCRDGEELSFEHAGETAPRAETPTHAWARCPCHRPRHSTCRARKRPRCDWWRTCPPAGGGSPSRRR